MTLSEFESSLSASSPPSTLPSLLKAMWFDAKGDWNAAHDIAQDLHSNDGSLIHAYLHRKEGDVGNAAYWYARAGEKFPTISLDEEWRKITMRLLKQI